MKLTKSFIQPVVIMIMAVAMPGASFQSAAAAKKAPVRMIPQNFSALADTVSSAVVRKWGFWD